MPIPDYYPNRAEAKIAARNIANAAINELGPKYAEHFRQFIGQKVLIAGENLSKKVMAGLPAKPGTIEVLWHRHSSYTITFELRASAYYKGTDNYDKHESIETYVSVGVIQDGILMSVNDASHRLRTDYTLPEIEEKRAIVAAAKAAVSQAQNDLYPFE